MDGREVLSERDELYGFQQRLDEAHGLLDDPDLTAEELAKLKADIEDARPDVLLRNMDASSPKQEGQSAPDDETVGPDASAWLSRIEPLPPL